MNACARGAANLTSAPRGGWRATAVAVSKDGEGDRTSQTVNGTTTNCTRNDDYELTATSGGFTNSYSYNANGEQTGRTVMATR